MLFMVLLIAFGLVLLVYFLLFVVSLKSLDDFESMSPYECGFDPSSLTRGVFSYRFFLISILFLIFDVEISLMLPIPFLVKSMMGLWLFIVFVIILVVGLLYEYYCGSLEWLSNFMSKA